MHIVGGIALLLLADRGVIYIFSPVPTLPQIVDIICYSIKNKYFTVVKNKNNHFIKNKK